MTEAQDLAHHSFCFPGVQPHNGKRKPLSGRQRKIYNLARVGWSPHQIANRIGIPPNSVYDALYKMKHWGWNV